jgi:hypothetical protein
MKKKIYCFDLDNVLCKTFGNNYKKSKPIKKNIKILRILKKEGYYIKIFTSRFMGRNKENQSLAKKQGYSFTKKQLKKWGISYDKLIFGKPSYDLFIDDKSIFYKKNWSKYLLNDYRKKNL